MIRRTTSLAAVLVLMCAGLGSAPGSAALAVTDPVSDTARVQPKVRFAQFNASLNRGERGALAKELSTPNSEQARNVAETIQRANPDVVLINEFDYSPRAMRLFRKNYLQRPQRGAEPVRYPYAYSAPVNTGVPSGHDLDNNGEVGGPGDAQGFGLFPGQYGMVVYSKYPIVRDQVRTFQNFRWADMPRAALPTDPQTGEPWYSEEELDVLRLSSKSHWDLPIRIGRRTIHLLTSHPTPPTFDGPEDRNGTRNHDEIRFWADYVSGPRKASYIYDDNGNRGGLKRGARFVIAGDQNADPFDGDSTDRAIWQLLDHPRVNTSKPPQSRGGRQAARIQGGANAAHRGDPRFDTADFADEGEGAPGNLRVDYVLPSQRLRITDSAVFWPVRDHPLYRLTGSYPPPTSDHRLIWVDVR